MKLQILVDMDGVLADVYSQFLQKEYEETGVRRTMESLDGKLEFEAFPMGEKQVNTPGFFRTVPLMPGSVEGLRYLNERYRVLIVSSATEFPNSLRDKYDWLYENYPFLTWRQLILCGTKAPVTGDIMLDDHPKNLDTFAGRKLLFTQPHNSYIDSPEYERMDSWEQVVNTL